MPYRKKYKSTASKNKKRIQFRRPTARNQKRQIASTQNQIIAIKKHLSLNKERMRWHCGFYQINITNKELIIPLTSGPSSVAPASVNNILGTPVPWEPTMTPVPQSTSALRSKVVVNKQYVDLTITVGAIQEINQYTAFVVQLQPKVAQQTYIDTGGMTNLSIENDFICPKDSLGNSTGYGIYVNNQRYKIIKRLEFETAGTTFTNATNYPSTGNTGRGTRSWALMRTQFKLNYGSTLMKSSGDQESSATLNYADINPEQKRFILLFSDNIVDDFPQVSMSSLITGYACE